MAFVMSIGREERVDGDENEEIGLICSAPGPGFHAGFL